jgi:hypothetical protein
MPGGNAEHFVEPVLKTRRVLLPEQIMQKDPHGGHPGGFGPAKLLVDLCWIVGVLLEHLELVDRIRRKKVAAHRPWLPIHVRPRLLFAPSFARLVRPNELAGGDENSQRCNQTSSANSDHALPSFCFLLKPNR